MSSQTPDANTSNQRQADGRESMDSLELHKETLQDLDTPMGGDDLVRGGGVKVRITDYCQQSQGSMPGS